MENGGGHFLIYIPGPFNGSKEEFERVGITDLGDDGSHTITQTDNGPDGKSGTLLGWEMTGGIEAVVPHYQPGLQTWAPAAQDELNEELKEGRYWYGLYKDRPVTPKKLKRKTKYLSAEITLCDGNEWLVPIAEHLPHVWTPRGRVIKDRFEHYSKLAQRYLDIYAGFSKVDEGLLLKEGWDFVCLGLALNYRITPDVIGGLKLIDDTTFSVFAMAAVELDVLKIIEDEKKKEDSRSTQDG